MKSSQEMIKLLSAICLVSIYDSQMGPTIDSIEKNMKKIPSGKTTAEKHPSIYLISFPAFCSEFQFAFDDFAKCFSFFFVLIKFRLLN
jgi:hypothetical protein